MEIILSDYNYTCNNNNYKILVYNNNNNSLRLNGMKYKDKSMEEIMQIRVEENQYRINYNSVLINLFTAQY